MLIAATVKWTNLRKREKNSQQLKKKNKVADKKNILKNRKRIFDYINDSI